MPGRRAPRWLLPLVLLAACARPPAPPPAPEAGLPAALSIVPPHAEVWAFSLGLSGARADGGTAALSSCRVVRDGVAFPARTDGTRWSATLPLRPGPNRVRVRCTDARGAALATDETLLTGMLRDAPVARARAALGDGVLVLDGSASAPSGGSAAPLRSFTWTERRGEEERPTGSGVRLRLTAPRGVGDGITFRLTVRDALGRADDSEVRLVSDRGRLVVLDASGDSGPSARDEVVYGVVPRLYGRPPLRAVADAIDDLASLGVTALWLSPLFETTPGDYGYAVTDYFRIRPDAGTEDDLHTLVAAAHRRGLRVLLDLVPNHTSDRHRYFRDASALGAASHYFRFYERDASGAAVHYFDWKNLPNLDYGNAETARFMLEATAHWLRDFGIDGYRVDAAWGIERREPGFWDAWRAEVRRIRPAALLVAEATARDPFWSAHGFDAAYDWTAELGKGAWEHAFDDPGATAGILDEAVRAARVPPLTFLENNDTGQRFVTRHGAETTRVAAAALLTLPGIPCLFTGEERGAEYEPYERADPLPPGDPHALEPWHRRLIVLRRSVPALRGGGYARLRPEPEDPRVYAFERRTEGGDTAVVLLRFDARAGTVRVPRIDGRWRDLVSARELAAAGGALEVPLPGWGVAVLVPAR